MQCDSFTDALEFPIITLKLIEIIIQQIYIVFYKFYNITKNIKIDHHRSPRNGEKNMSSFRHENSG